MKKIVALLLCLVMVVGLMAGCEKAMDIKTLTQKMDEASKNQTAMAAKMDMDLEMSMGVTGVTMTMAVGMDMDMKMDMAKGDMYMDMDATVEMLGQSEDVSMEIYGAVEDGDMTVYMHEGSTDTWTKTVEEDYAAQTEELVGVTMTMSEIPEEKMSLAKEKETVNGKECYVLSMDLDGTYIEDAMKLVMEEAMAAETEEPDEETKAMLESIDWSAMNVKMVYYVDAETFLPVQMTAEVLGLGDVMQSMFSGLLAEMMLAMDSEEVEFSIDVPVCSINMTDVVYGDMEIPAVPQEAIDNAIDADTIVDEGDLFAEDPVLANPPQEDGSFLLTLGTDSVRVVMPEGFTVFDADADYLYASTADDMNYISVMPLGDMTVEDVQLEVENAAIWAQEEGYYKSHSAPVELNGFTAMDLIYNDGTSVWYAWKELDSCILLVCAEVEGETFDMESLLTNVEILAE